MKAWILAPLLCAGTLSPALAQQPAPLVVGSVRDQAGDVVADATVTASSASGSPLVSGHTAADGTFALDIADAASVHIECDFCLPLTLQVSTGEPLVAIVHRFTAVMQRGPSAADVAALPYAHAESVLSLTPFTVLDDSSNVVPGPYVSDRGLASGGGLVLDTGVPVYDVTANQSPFVSLPLRAAQSVSLADAGSAFRYGDRADGGIAAFDTQNQNRAALALASSDSILQANAGSSPFSAAGFFSNNAFESRQRFDGTVAASGSDGSLGATILAERGDFAPDATSNLVSSFSALRLSFERTRAQRVYGQLILDRGSYGASFSGNETTANWSDIGARIGVESTSRVPLFLEASFHRASGDWSAPGPLPTIAATLTHTQLSAGISAQGAQSDLLAGVSAFGIAYNGGPAQSNYAVNASPASTGLLTPSIDYRWHPARRWSLDSLAASTFRLPTFVERYGMPPVADVVSYDRNSLFQETIEYTDRSRMRASFTAYRQQTSGLDNGAVAGAGASLAWALSTHWSLRSWFLRETDTRVQTMPYVKLASTVPLASVGSVWLTYENESHLRADVILRRDLLDDVGFNHLDGALSIPIGSHNHLFASSELRQKRRFFDIGLRFDR